MKLLLASLTLILATSCASFQNDIAHDGGLVGTYKGDYIVRNDSGGRIMDVWKLRNVFVDQSGLFRDEHGNVLSIKGDLRIMRVNDTATWDRYHEYHAEFETKSYQELYVPQLHN